MILFGFLLSMVVKSQTAHFTIDRLLHGVGLFRWRGFVHVSHISAGVVPRCDSGGRAAVAVGATEGIGRWQGTTVNTVNCSLLVGCRRGVATALTSSRRY